MKRSQFIRSAALSVGAIAFSSSDVFAAMRQAPWKITMLNSTVGIFEEKGGTILFYLGKKAVVVVDAQFPDQSKHLIDELTKKTMNPFGFLINTHHHGDHTSGNISFKGVVGHVVAHANSKTNQQSVAEKNKTEEKQLYPDMTFTNTWTEKMDKEKIAMHYFGAAHTNGDSFVHLEHSNIVHCGDLVFNRRHPFVDRTAGANMKSWIDVLEKGLKKFDAKTKFVFGHSAEGYTVTGKTDDLKTFQDYLANVLKLTEAEIKAGKTKEEFLKNNFVPGSEEWKGDGIQRPLMAAWEELTDA